MAQKKSIDVDYPVLDPLQDRVYVQEVTYLAEDGRPITQKKMAYLDRAQKTLMGLLAEGQGMEIVHVQGDRR